MTLPSLHYMWVTRHGIAGRPSVVSARSNSKSTKFPYIQGVVSSSEVACG